MKKTIAVIFGGEGLEREISIKSASNILASLSKNLYTPLPIYINSRGEWFYYSGDFDMPDSKTLEENSSGILKPTYPERIFSRGGFMIDGEPTFPDIAIVALHGNFGEDGIIQGALQSAKIKTLSQSVLACAITSDKAVCKAVAKCLKIPIAKYALLTDKNATRARLLAEKSLTYPMFLKSASFGSSFGVSRVNSPCEFEKEYGNILAMGEERILAEEYIDCDYELECGYIDFGEKRFIPKGVIHAGGRFYSYPEKYSSISDFSPEISEIPSKISKKIVEYSSALCENIGIKYMSRIDFFVRGDEVIFNEINTFPGMTKTSLYPKMLENEFGSFSECLTRLISHALCK